MQPAGVMANYVLLLCYISENRQKYKSGKIIFLNLIVKEGNSSNGAPSLHLFHWPRPLSMPVRMEGLVDMGAEKPSYDGNSESRRARTERTLLTAEFA